ncbi:ABC transporter substrate-binding protein [Modestobacter sp. VKM Ac-2979]|uniref:ABC transporter substrate-binding protein n=1 Tax=unclassified Modestobacter TaxID=2643866 RepID=UPI0022AB6E42|nr:MULTISPECIES: ABC transporter substrate-binding protein [unclassified Modestobacter]MCZ2813885.1 ABC transporter substrate-binding protein [Modestobacter sp. VKM Ac-2979]MCZ2844140.1 ABC transporter substrate-binding protein [Modestobacter sp. VKM Ac-2980]
MNTTRARRSPSRIRSLAAAAALGLLLSACSVSDPEAPAADGEGGDATFSIAVGIDPDTFDPAGQTTTTVSNMVDYVVETLVEIDDEGEIAGVLAESYEVSEDGLTLTFELREGVTFQDGTPFDAEAVVYNLERITDPELTVPQGAAFAAFESATAVDENTVEVSLSQPSPGFVSALSATVAGIISPTSVDAEGNSYQEYTRPVGTGPYEFGEYTAGESLTVTKYDDYWGEEPYYETVVFRVVPEAATRESLLLAGQVDMIILPPVSDIEALQANEDVEVLLAESDRTIFIALDNTDPVMQDPRVRQALNYAVDKQAIIDNVLFGAAEVLDAPMAPSLFGYCETGSYEYDPEQARQLLEEAGAVGASIELLTPSGRYVQDAQAAEAIAGYLREAGLDVSVSTSDFPSFLARVNAPVTENTPEAHLLGWAPAYLDADFQMQMFRQATHPPAGLGTSFYTNPEVEALLAQADVETDRDTREQLYCDASQIIWDDAPWIFLWTQSFPIVYDADITGVSATPVEKFDAMYARPAN